MNNILITGGAGFIASNFIRYLIKDIQVDNYNIINFDALTYSGNLENLKDLTSSPLYTFIKGDICNTEDLDKLFSKQKIDYIINFAAESHVDRSILSAKQFIDTNIHGVFNLLEYSRNNNVKKFIQISTDEVYGSIDTGKFFETSPIKPNSPYSASKASADLLVLSYFNTYNFPGIVTRCSNNYGEYQFPEKLIPLMILNALDNKKLPIYGDGKNVRDWIHVKDHCSAIWRVFESGQCGNVYNIGANCEMDNLTIVKIILDCLNKPYDLIEFVKDRLGHDRRYAIDFSKITNELAWKPKHEFRSSLEQTVDWYVNNIEWCNNIRNGNYFDYYDKQYSRR